MLYANADQDAARQQQQAESVLTQGANVLVLDAVDAAAAASIVAAANERGVKVIAYDRFIADAPVDYYVSFDNTQVGEMQGKMVVDGLKANGVDPAAAVVVYIGGDPTDGNAKMFHDGAVSVMEAAGIKPAAEPADRYHLQRLPGREGLDPDDRPDHTGDERRAGCARGKRGAGGNRGGRVVRPHYRPARVLRRARCPRDR